MMQLLHLVDEYYVKRGLKWPTSQQAVLWAITELGEVCELLLSREGGWVRNNPDDKEGFSSARVAEELGDVIMMCVVAGMVLGENPLGHLESKMRRKLDEVKHAEQGEH
jgi:NTP pyrophosphatase (non-canonical NTP hydrolase)